METNDKKIEMLSFVVSGKTLFESPVPDNPMLWGHFLPKIGIAILAGGSDCGKSSLMRQLSGAIVFEEKEFLGIRLDASHKSVIYVSSEDTEDDIKRIMKREHLEGRNGDQYNSIHYIFDIEKIEENIEKLLQICQVDCVILDSLNDFIRGDANNAFFARRFLESIRIMVMKYRCLFVLIHHYRKSAPDTNPSKNDVLGSQSFEAKARVVISMEKDGNNSNERFLRITKGNYVSDELKSKVLRICPDKNFVFKSVGELLVSKGDITKAPRKIDEKMGQIILMLHGQEKSLRQIETSLNGMGHKISRTTIGEFLKRQNLDVRCQES